MPRLQATLGTRAENPPVAGEDARLARNVMREFNRRTVDSSRISVHASHGIVYLRGELRGIRGSTTDLEKELHTICQNIRRRYGVRDIISEVTIL
jgi:hypothetical protein